MVLHLGWGFIFMNGDECLSREIILIFSSLFIGELKLRISVIIE